MTLSFTAEEDPSDGSANGSSIANVMSLAVTFVDLTAKAESTVVFGFGSLVDEMLPKAVFGISMVLVLDDAVTVDLPTWSGKEDGRESPYENEAIASLSVFSFACTGLEDIIIYVTGNQFSCGRIERGSGHSFTGIAAVMWLSS
jgi:hypothetical protein